MSADLSIGNVFFFEVKGSRQLEEAASGVTPAIQDLNICSGVITSRILGGGIYPQDSRGGIYPQDSNNPNNPPISAMGLRHWVAKIDLFKYQSLWGKLNSFILPTAVK